ncbi:hypothetical protein V2A60_002489 [Cordyceps javanica]
MSLDNEGWTRVHRNKSRQSTPAKPRSTDCLASSSSSSPPPPPPADSLTFAPRTTGVFRRPEALRADYDRIRSQWLQSEPAHEALVQLVDAVAATTTTRRPLVVTKAVCLGIGTFDPEDGAWEAKRAAFVQLCALTTLVSQLEKYSKTPIQCIFQEPIFTDADKTFLASLGHRVVSSPQAYDLVDDTTLLFAIHLYRPIYAAALKSNLPAVFVGTGWDVWDTVRASPGRTNRVSMERVNDLENMQKMHATYARHPFPQDAASTAFSSTSIYFAPPPSSVERDSGDDG